MRRLPELFYLGMLSRFRRCNVIQLAIPVFYNDDIFTHVEIQEPSPATLADTQKEIEKTGNYFKAIHVFLSGSIMSYHGKSIIDNKQQIYAITRLMPYTTASMLALDVLVDLNDDDFFEGVYHCPRCGYKIICEKAGDEDTRDAISSLHRTYMEEHSNRFGVDLIKHATLVKGEETEEITSIALHYPTLSDTIAAFSKIPTSDPVTRQYQIYVEAIELINGEAKPDAWKANFGLLTIQHVSIKDIRKIGNEVRRYGVDEHIEKTCSECGKVFRARVNTANFFVSALQSNEEYI